MNSIERLKREYDIHTHIDDGKVVFTGLWIWMDRYRKEKGKIPVWSEISSLMHDAEIEINQLRI